MKTCAFVSVGCKVNQYETELVREQFLSLGFKETNTDQSADYYFINTCTVTHNSDSDCRNLIRRVHSVNPQAKIIVTGCYVERDIKAIKNLGIVEQIIPNNKKFCIPEIIFGHKDHVPKIINQFKDHDRAFVKVQDGCNNFCSYCVVPYVRGRSCSRELDEIKEEIETLIENGYLEIVLCGVCLGDYGKDKDSSIVDLLKNLVEIEGDFRIRLSSIEPKDINEELIDLIADNYKVCKHLHIPVQSGDNQILRLMNRPYTYSDLAELVRRAYRKIPDLCISVDIIVGFPDESEKQFNNTVKLLKEIGPQRTHIFTYSKRPGTKAVELKNNLPIETVRRRRDILSKLSQRLSFNSRKKFLNKNLRVLVESQLSSDNMAYGYSDNYIRVKINKEVIDRPRLSWANVKKVDLDVTIATLVS